MDPISIALLGSGLVSTVGSMLTNSKQLEFNAKEARFSRVFSREEAEKARQFSKEESALNRQFEARQAQINRDWQTDMSNSAYQRSVVDMEKAGLNPNLMSGGLQAQVGNVSTPQGSQASSAVADTATASSGNLANAFNGIANALNAYATINNQKMIAAMYNATSRENSILYNDTKRLGYDIHTANFDRSVWKYRKTNSSARM